MTKLHTKDTDELFRAILTLKNTDECYKFFEDICTINEIRDIAQRLSVAQLLSDGRIYSEISRETGASTATISRVNRSYSYGTGAYKTVLARLDKKD